ncbi:helix-turn-helix domain-containing protein [Microvirga terrae]|uniref:Helix-turn-helix domain-containing protein n=1 Tax=Microvirga terrae TaxID=2740529 RepID=A0ABY5RXF3_9HYPH|nr:helix-turn-helix domain-containing protein [Microvirga terrae]UVF21946.1 helix-turn-helix domain-containing protein [Microvirga terrae]
MTPAEVSQHFGGAVSTRTLANWRSMSQGPAYVKVGGRVLYPAASIAEWEQKRTVGGTGQYRA